jgi:hypothetical protein
VKRLSILALVLLICASVSADMSRFTPPDPRLDKKVTLDVNNTKLEEVAKSLTEQTGITIKAGSGQRDWKVRERTVTIHAKDQSAGKMLDEISRVLGFYISREGKDKEWTYIIWQDKKSRDLEAEMITAEKEADAQRIKDMREAAVDAAAKALKMSPEDAMKLKGKDPWTAFMGGTKTGRGFAGLLSSLQSLFPTEYDLMMRGKSSAFPLSGLPAGPRKALQDALSGGFANDFKSRMGDMANGLTPVQLTSMPMDGLMNGNMADQMGWSGLLFISGIKPGDRQYDGNQFSGMPMTFFPMVSPNSLGAAAFGELLFDVESGTSLDEANKKLESKFNAPALLAQMLAHDSPTEKEPPTDPELTREVEIKADALPKSNSKSLNGDTDQESQGKVIEEISRALGTPVLMESFHGVLPLSVFIKAGKQPVYKILIALEKGNYSWERGDGALRVRPNDWALRRSYLIPGGFLAYYKDLIKQQEMLTLDDLAAIATSLTDDQIQRTLLADPDLAFLMMSVGGGVLGGSRDMLRLYGSLTADQKQALQSDNGLPFSQLTDKQWDQINKIITDRFGGLYVTDGKVKMDHSEATIAAGVRSFAITIQVNGEEKPREMTQTVMVPGKDQIAQMTKMRKQMQDKAKAAGQTKDAKPADPDAPK